MNKIVKYSLIFLSVSMLLTSCKGKNKSNQPAEEPATSETSGGNPDAGDYYSSISDSLSGSSLRSALNTLNNQKKKKNVTYAGMRQFAAKCDIDPDGSGKIIGFYDNAKVGPSWDGGGSWNREHVWPNSRGGGTVEGDAHMPRPTSTKINSDRGSWGYSATGSYDPGMYVAFYRGVSARIIFYCMIANTNLKLTDDVLSDKNGSTPANTMGTLSDLLKWNLQYLPNASGLGTQDDLARRTELNRNNVIEKDPSGQGNRNPFIDHPEYACKIWGSTNSKTKQICGM